MGGYGGCTVKSVTRALLLVALLITACGAERPELVLRQFGLVADAYGFSCECGCRTFEVLGRTLTRMRVRCAACHHEWVIHT